MREYFTDRQLFRVANDGLVLGFLTHTDCFVSLREPMPESNVPDDGLRTVGQGNTLLADAQTLLPASSKAKAVDSDRVRFIRRIQKETQAFNVFRNTVRALLNDYTHRALRNTLKAECVRPYALYEKKLETVSELLRTLVRRKVVFAEDYDDDAEEAEETNKAEAAGAEAAAEAAAEVQSMVVCDDDEEEGGGDRGCRLVLPKRNAVNGLDNEVFYIAKMADELVRYNRIQSFMFRRGPTWPLER